MIRPVRYVLTVLIPLTILSLAALAARPITPAPPVHTLPHGPGLAARYPGDAGIERDPNVIFSEGFEQGTVAQIGARWGEVSNKGGKVMALSTDVPSGGRGRRSLQMTARVEENTGGHLYTVMKQGLDQT
jgi:hypothetical protein